MRLVQGNAEWTVHLVFFFPPHFQRGYHAGERKLRVSTHYGTGSVVELGVRDGRERVK